MLSAWPASTEQLACTSPFSRLARRSLSLRPVCSPSHLVTLYPEGFSRFVTSMLLRLLLAGAIAPDGIRTQLRMPSFMAHAELGCVGGAPPAANPWTVTSTPPREPGGGVYQGMWGSMRARDFYPIRLRRTSCHWWCQLSRPQINPRSLTNERIWKTLERYAQAQREVM